MLRSCPKELIHLIMSFLKGDRDLLKLLITTLEKNDDDDNDNIMIKKMIYDINIENLKELVCTTFGILIGERLLKLCAYNKIAFYGSFVLHTFDSAISFSDVDLVIDVVSTPYVEDVIDELFLFSDDYQESNFNSTFSYSSLPLFKSVSNFKIRGVKVQLVQTNIPIPQFISAVDFNVAKNWYNVAENRLYIESPQDIFERRIALKPFPLIEPSASTFIHLLIYYHRWIKYIKKGYKTMNRDTNDGPLMIPKTSYSRNMDDDGSSEWLHYEHFKNDFQPFIQGQIKYCNGIIAYFCIDIDAKEFEKFII